MIKIAVVEDNAEEMKTMRSHVDRCSKEQILPVQSICAQMGMRSWRACAPAFLITKYFS